MKKLTVIVVSYNTKKLLKDTLLSIPGHQDWQTVVIDNGSSDGSAAMVGKEFPGVKLMENHENVGFARANNQVIQATQSKYVLLLNSDTVVEPGAIETLVNYMDIHQEAAVITPKIVLKDGRLDSACHRGMPTPWNSFCYYAGLEKLFPNSRLFAGYHQGYLPMDKTHAIEATAGTAMLVRRSAIDAVGLLDERFFMYAEDLDWCLRFRKAGWKIIFFPLVTIHHLKSRSGMKHEARSMKHETQRHFYDTMKQFYEKHYQAAYPAWLRLLVYKGIDLKKWLATR